MKTIRSAVIAAALLTLVGNLAFAQSYALPSRPYYYGPQPGWVAPQPGPVPVYQPERYYPTGPYGNGYVYYAPSVRWVNPAPAYSVSPAPVYYGYGQRGIPPYAYGSPTYNGYGDPYYPTYGRGVREFLRFGGADFYGW